MPSSYTNLLYHLVFSTKERRPLITPELSADLYPYLGGIVRQEGGMLLEVGGMPDHVHLVARFRADLAVADMMRVIKANSSKWVNERAGRTEQFAWQTGYGAFTISGSQLEVVRRYVQRQEEHHRKHTFQEEFVAFLKKHGIAYDERYLWD